MVRIGCMHMSVSEEAYSTDATPIRFIRKPKSITYSGYDIIRKPSFYTTEYKVIAMPIDTFVCLANNSINQTTQDFDYKGLDIDWTAVPISNSIIGQGHIVPYIAGFMTSDLWAGTVNHYYDVE